MNYASSVINKLKALLTDDARVIAYDCHEFIVQATAVLGSLGSAILSNFLGINGLFWVSIAMTISRPLITITSSGYEFTTLQFLRNL